MNAKTRYFTQILLEAGEKKSNLQHLQACEKVIYCLAHLDGLEGCQTYLRKLVVDASNRIYQRRHNSEGLRFGHNETVMIERLYWHLK